MSEGLWITGPDHQWVAEDHVLALADFLALLGAHIDHIASALNQVERTDITTAEGFLASVSFDEVARIRIRIEELARVASELFSALWEYALATAAQERARINTFDAPRDRLLAVVAMTLTGGNNSEGFHSWGFTEAAQALIPEDSVFDSVTVTKGYVGGVVSQASTFAERVYRIPDDPRYPIRVERYPQLDGSTQTDVYIAGTRDMGVGFSAEPFDMESNIALIAGATSASLVAVEKAMKIAGVKPGDRVTFVGHSQGGLIAARLAESGRYATTGLLTVGAPLGGTPTRGDYPAVAFTHRDDAVPHLGGLSEPSKAIGVSRHSGKNIGDLGGAHSLDAYQASATDLDSTPAGDRLGRFPVSPGSVHPTYFSARRD